MLLLKQETRILLKEQVNKINCLSPAFDNTFVLSVVLQPVRSEAILRISADGEVLFKREYSCEIGGFAMLRDKEVMVLNRAESVIEVINLEEESVFRVNHNYLLDDVDQMQLLTFSDTKYFCLLEHDEAGALFRATYYDYNTLRDSPFPISSHEQTMEEEDHGLAIFKANEHSTIAWLVPEQSDLVEFHTWDLRQQTGGRYNCVSVRNTLGETYNMDELLITIHNLWETRTDTYCIVCTSNRNQDQHTPINNNFIVDAKQGIVREAAPLLHPANHKDFLTDTFSLGSCSVFYSRRLPASSSPIFFVSHETEAILAIDEWSPSSHYNFYVAGFDSSNLVMAEYDNGDVKEIRVVLKRLAEQREVALHLMLGVNQDFDDDLLQDALDLMGLIS